MGTTVTNNSTAPAVINYRPTHPQVFFEGGLISRITPICTLGANYSNDNMVGRGVAHMAGTLLTANTNHRDIASRMPQRNWVNMLDDVTTGRFASSTPDDVVAAARAEGRTFSNHRTANQYTMGHLNQSFIYDDDTGYTIQEGGTDRQNAWRIDECHLANTEDGMVISG